MRTHINPEIAEQELVDLLDAEQPTNALILYNDDVNTFDFVTESLIKVCGHDPVQAEQCTYLVHYTGRCAVKEGSFAKLKPMCEALLDRGLSARIE